MNVLLYGRYGEHPQEIESLVTGLDFSLVSKNPELVITYGGDGTLVGAERDFPGTAKLPLKDSRICHRCIPLSPDQTLKAFLNNQLELTEFSKLEVTVGEEKLYALNDVIIRNTSPNVALRFDLNCGTNEFPGLIGDGVVIATPFGSSGYYHSITKNDFSDGLGIAFNNLCDTTTPAFITVGNDDSISVMITRGPGTLSADNDPELIKLGEGVKIEVALAKESAKIYTLS